MKLTHEIAKYTFRTPYGVLLAVEACDKGIHRIQPVVKGTESANDEKETPPKAVESSLKWLQEYFYPAKSPAPSTLDPKKYPPICWDGLGLTDFSENVLKTLTEKIKHGETIPYSELATLIGKPGASRAVGTALKNNPVHILIPCHRIVRADGEIGKYAGGGGDVKQWLIKFEKGEDLTPQIFT